MSQVGAKMGPSNEALLFFAGQFCSWAATKITAAVVWVILLGILLDYNWGLYNNPVLMFTSKKHIPTLISQYWNGTMFFFCCGSLDGVYILWSFGNCTNTMSGRQLGQLWIRDTAIPTMLCPNLNQTREEREQVINPLHTQNIPKHH